VGNKKENFLSFLFGLVIGNKGIPIAWHVFYVAVIVAVLLAGPLLKMIPR